MSALPPCRCWLNVYCRCQAVDAATGFNRRVTEGKLAAKLVAKKAGLPNWASIQTMLELEVLPCPWLHVVLMPPRLCDVGMCGCGSVFEFVWVRVFF